MAAGLRERPETKTDQMPRWYPHTGNGLFADVSFVRSANKPDSRRIGVEKRTVVAKRPILVETTGRPAHLGRNGRDARIHFRGYPLSGPMFPRRSMKRASCWNAGGIGVIPGLALLVSIAACTGEIGTPMSGGPSQTGSTGGPGSTTGGVTTGAVTTGGVTTGAVTTGGVTTGGTTTGGATNGPSSLLGLAAGPEPV